MTMSRYDAAFFGGEGMKESNFFEGWLKGVTVRGGQLFGRSARRQALQSWEDLIKLCYALLSSQGEATGMALAEDILDGWLQLDEADRRKVMNALLVEFGPDVSVLDDAIAAYKSDPTLEKLHYLHNASEPRRQELLRRLNFARNGTVMLVDMRRQLQSFIPQDKELAIFEADFLHLFSSWFNRGFLELSAIDWSTPANVLEKIIRYEAVHEIKDWGDLRRRLEPEDRRCFAFFHPRLPSEPLIFVEIALTKDIPADVAQLLADERIPIAKEEATTAVFYSISNCQVGLKGVSFGNFLIKQVVDELRRELPNLKTFVTLSPVPGLAKWLRGRDGFKSAIDHNNGTCQHDELMVSALEYLLSAKGPDGRHIDPVARFHLGNGARLERILPKADNSTKGQQQSFGVMVNYLYKLDDIVANHEAYVQRGEVIASRDLARLWQSHNPSRVQRKMALKQFLPGKTRIES